MQVFPHKAGLCLGVYQCVCREVFRPSIPEAFKQTLVNKFLKMIVKMSNQETSILLRGYIVNHFVGSTFFYAPSFAEPAQQV